jgi:hypothetical protein
MGRSAGTLQFAGWAILISLLTAWSTPHVVQAAEQETSLEYQVKAAFLLNFIKFIVWPGSESAGSDTPFRICIVGTDPFGGVLDQMVEGERYRHRKLAVERVHGQPPASCQVVFVGSSEKDIDGLLSSLGPGVLTVGEGPDFLRSGGLITFIIENHRVRFDVNEGAAVRAGLKVSSKLLSVARSVAK